MKPSLEDERRALLAQIEASRAVYRRMLSGDTALPAATEPHSQGLAPASGPQAQAGFFPRSRTMQWAMDHPMAIAAGVALLVWLAPRVWQRRTAQKSQAARQAHKEARTQEVLLSGREGSLRALLTAAALLLRNPATMRAVTRAAGIAWHWLQQRRQRRGATARTTH